MKRLLPVLLAGALSAVVSMTWGSAPAHAHAVLTASTPADGASVERSPSQALLTFSEDLDPMLSAVHVLDSSGEQVEEGESHVPAGQPAQIRVALGELAQGSYTMTWRVTSVLDGHTTAGSVVFGVGTPASAAGTQGEQAAVRSPGPTAASIAGRWSFYAGVVVMLGAAVVGVAVASSPAVISTGPLAAAWMAAAGGLLITIADQAASARTDLANLLSSSTGQRLMVQVLAVALAGLAVVWACLRPNRSSLIAVGIGASAATLGRSLSGHANASSLRWFTVGAHWIHLLAVGAWIGGLLWLLVAMRRDDPGQGPGLARRFSSVAAGTLGVVVVSGGVRALDEVGAWRRLVDTAFGLTLLAKLALFAVLVALGARSRLRHVPKALSGRPGGLRRGVQVAVATAAGVLGVTAVLAGLPPSSSIAAASKTSPAPSVAVSGEDYGTSVRVRLVVTPGSAGPNRFDATVQDYDTGEPVPAEAVSLRFELDDRPDVAPATLALAQDGSSHWRGAGSELSMEGRWTVTAVVQTPTDAVEVPMEVMITPSGASESEAPVAGANCGSGQPDASYSVTIEPDPDPPRAEQTTLHLTVRRDGRAVAGAKVCVKADMPGMQHPGVFTVASEGPPGSYDAKLSFSMTGSWKGSVTIVEPGRAPVSVPMEFEVR